MAVLSNVFEALNWAFSPGQHDLKHMGAAHPVFSFLVSSLITLVPTYLVADYLEKKFPKLKGEFPSWSRRKLAGVLVAYVIMMLVARYKFLGKFPPKYRGHGIAFFIEPNC